jgi:ribonuclease P protein component
LREVLRHHLHKLSPGYDCLIVARSGAVEANYGELESALLQLLIRSRVLIDEPGDSEMEGSLS